VITRKDRPLTPNLRAIKRLPREISQARVFRLVHGGGSYGHSLAEQYRIQEGYKDSSQIIGFKKTHQAMVTLDKLIVDALIDEGVSAVAIPPSACIITKLGRIHLMEERPLTKLLELGFIPVLYEDVVIDSDTGFAMLSSDQLVAYIAIRLDAVRIIVGVDLDGLYTADPKTDPSARLIQLITLGELRKLHHRIEETKVTDVTGGMLGKVLELISTIERGISAMILNVGKPGNVYKALKSEGIAGTIIEGGKPIA